MPDPHIDKTMTATPQPAAKPARPRRPRRAAIPAELRCESCGREKCIRWRRRWWCIRCDERALFGEGRKR